MQLGGAVGTLSALGDSGLEVVADVARQLGLAEPELPWHTVRLRPARLACALAAALGAMGKIARDVVLLAQTEVAEVMEADPIGRGGSSTMPHKRNPVGAVAVVACAQRAPGLAATVLSAMAQEHERAAGAWQAEWETQTELLRLAGSAAAALKEVLDGLVVDAGQMRANLERTGQLLMSESVAVALSGSLGRPAAQKLVEKAAARAVGDRRSLREVLLELPEVADGLGPERLDRGTGPGALPGRHQRVDRPSARESRMTIALNHEFTGPDGGPVVVLSNSIGTSLSMWDAQAAALARRLRVLRYDTRGHGASPVPAGPYSIEDLAGDLLAMLDANRIERASLCGLSIGAMTCIAAAARAPERVDRLILCCTSSWLGPERSAAYRERAAAVREGGLEPIADAVVDRWLTPAFRRAHPDVTQRMRDALRRDPGRGVRGLLRGALADGSARCARQGRGSDAGDRRRRGSGHATRRRRADCRRDRWRAV